MMLMASISIGYQVVFYSVKSTGQNPQWIYYLRPPVIVLDMINYGLLFRYARLQTQLKASEENSKVIVAQIRRFRTMQYILYFFLSLYALDWVTNIVTY